MVGVIFEKHEELRGIEHGHVGCGGWSTGRTMALEGGGRQILEKQHFCFVKLHYLKLKTRLRSKHKSCYTHPKLPSCKNLNSKNFIYLVKTPLQTRSKWGIFLLCLLGFIRDFYYFNSFQTTYIYHFHLPHATTRSYTQNPNLDSCNFIQSHIN